VYDHNLKKYDAKEKAPWNFPRGSISIRIMKK
jgi:hypothetical protein